MNIPCSAIGRRLALGSCLLMAFAPASSDLRAEDCNGNGAEDRVDIAEGISLDCNRNGVPDECEEERDLYFGARERYEVCSDGGASARRLVCGDFDGDGDKDVATVCTPGPDPSRGVLSLLWNSGSGRFGPVENLELEMRARELLSDDFDGDGDLDLLAVNHGLLPLGHGWVVNRMDLYMNDGTGGFELSGSYDTGPRPLWASSGDLDGDGAPDVVVKIVDDTGLISILRNRGDGTFEKPRHLKAGYKPVEPHIADIDGDGLHDIVTVLWLRGVSVLKNRGELRFEGPEVYEAGPGRDPGGSRAATSTGTATSTSRSATSTPPSWLSSSMMGMAVSKSTCS